MSQKLTELGRIWAESKARLRLSIDVKKHWDDLVEAWVNEFELPLAVRKMGVGTRGAAILHRSSGREIVLSDNSPAQWAFDCARKGLLLSIDDIRRGIAEDRIPFAFATKKSDQSAMKYKATLSRCRVDLNAEGWKLCHMRPVGMRSRTAIEDTALQDIKDHFRLLMKPSNHFVVPKEWSGLGEIPEVIAEISKFESSH